MSRFYLMCMTLFLLLSSSAFAQSHKVTGQVISAEDGQPVIAATVLVKGTVNSAITSVDGTYEITVPNNTTTLVFQYVGMVTKEIEVGKQTVINVTLEADTYQIEQVVVTALGIKRSEKALGYSVQKVSGDDISKVKGVDVATSLTGKVSGLLVKNSTDFGAVPNVTIRGEQPLLVIDGIAYANKSLTDIASEDVESMSILKGATASALYGFRGASGAILITTKSGSTNNEGISVELSSNTMFAAGFLALPEKQAIWGRGTNNTYNKNSAESWGAKMEGQILNQWDPYAMEYRDYAYNPVGADNFKNYLVPSYITNNNINVAYGSKVASLRSSLNWTQNSGQYPNQVLDKFSYALGGDLNLGKFTLSSNASYTRRTTPNMGTNGYTSYDPMYALLVGSAADFDIRDYKDNYWITPGLKQNYTYQSGYNNPYFDAYEKTIESNRDIFNIDASTSYEVNNWLKISARSGLDFFLDKGVIRVAKGSYTSTGNTPIPGNSSTWFGGTTGGYAIGQTQGLSMNSDILFTGDGSFGDFTVDYLAGGTIFYQKNTTLLATTDGGISSPGFYSLAASVNKPNASQSGIGRQVNSVYGRAAISWKRMLFAEATGRNDWSSTQAGTDSPSYFYPSFAGSFIVSELLPSTKSWLEMLKLRGSWTMSKTPAAIYDTNIAFTVSNATWGNWNGASAPSYLYSPNVVPAAANTLEFGLQGNLFKNRLMVDVSYYNKKMYDFLLKAGISEASGYSQKLVNTEEVISRKGWEVSLRGTVIQNHDWKLNLGANWSTFSRHYVKLDPQYTPVKPWIYEGARVDAYISKDFSYDPQGNIIWTNGRIIPSTFDSVFGYSDPDWLWGANATLQWKNFSFYASFDGVVGGQMGTRTESYMWQVGVHPDSAGDQRLKPYIGEGVKIVSGTATYDAFGNITSDTRVFAKNDIETTYQQYIKDLHASSAWGGNGTRPDVYSKTFVKLREISLSYDVPKTFISPLKLKGASISLIGQNVFMWAKDFKYSDPDGGSEDFSDPSVRYIGGSLKLTF